MRHLAQGIAKMVNHLGQREPSGGMFGGLSIILERFVGHAALRKVPGDDLRLWRFARGVFFQHLGEAPVDRAALLAQQGGIIGLLHERMPEGVPGGRRLTMRNNDFSSCKRLAGSSDTACMSSNENSRPMTAPVLATSLPTRSRSSLAMSEE